MKTKILKICTGVFVCLIFVTPSFATTYYVRVNGGTATQCTGLADAAYPGSGTSQACAFNHPFWAISPNGNNPTKMVGGDTLIIDGSNGAQYMIGTGAPNTSDNATCNSSWSYDCVMRPIPSGPDPTHPTRILGKGWDTGCSSPPQLWGTGRPWQVISLAKSNNVELQCLEITDHSACQEGGPNACNRSIAPYGPWASIGIYAADSSNVLLKNLNIHGLAKEGIHAGRLKDWTLDGTKIVANSFAGWDGDIGATTSSNSGTITFNKSTIAYSGCGETYPGKQPYNCYSQDQGGYGDGLGTATTGANWVFTDSDISHNVSDGIDLLYHNGSGTVTIKRLHAEGNASNQVKVATTTNIDNSIIIGNCAYFNNNSVTWQSSGFNNCRAMGNAVVFSFKGGKSASITDSTVLSNGDNVILSSGSGCTGSEKITSRNNIFIGRPEYNAGGSDLAALYYSAGATGNGDGTCGHLPFDDDYSVIYGTKFFSSDCSGKAHSKCQDPKLVEPLVSYYTGNAYNTNLQSNSPSANSAVTITGASSLDYNSYDRGTSWDVGALEYGSIPTSASNTAPVCGDKTCNGIETCSTCPGDCGVCAAACGDGVCNGTETCSTCSKDCGACPPSCGDGVCNGTETCSTCPGDCGQCCVPTWCDAPLQDCSLPPLTGTDSCGNSCTKPSPQWPNCISCVSNGSCSASAPACGQTTTGTDNCGKACTKTGPVCCVSDGSCSAPAPACGQATTGTDNCGNSCTKTGPVCCVSDGSCSASAPACGQATTGTDNCGNSCTKTGSACIVCGNGRCEAGETCSSCSSDCGICPAVCGNRIKEGTEQCDDGNLVNGDGCSSTCTIEKASTRRGKWWRK